MVVFVPSRSLTLTCQTRPGPISKLCGAEFAGTLFKRQNAVGQGKSCSTQSVVNRVAPARAGARGAPAPGGQARPTLI